MAPLDRLARYRFSACSAPILTSAVPACSRQQCRQPRNGRLRASRRHVLLGIPPFERFAGNAGPVGRRPVPVQPPPPRATRCPGPPGRPERRQPVWPWGPSHRDTWAGRKQAAVLPHRRCGWGPSSRQTRPETRKRAQPARGGRVGGGQEGGWLRGSTHRVLRYRGALLTLHSFAAKTNGCIRARESRRHDSLLPADATVCVETHSGDKGSVAKAEPPLLQCDGALYARQDLLFVRVFG